MEVEDIVTRGAECYNAKTLGNRMDCMCCIEGSFTNASSRVPQGLAS